MTIIIGHRGARDLWPENSLSGFVRTAQLGIGGVEFDVHLTAADEVVVIHDATLERTTNGSGDVALLTPAARRLTTLRDTDGEWIPLLAEVLDVFRDTSMEVHVELKVTADGRRYVGLAERCLATIGDLGMQEQCVIASFDPDALEEVLALEPGCRTLASISARSVQRFGGIRAALVRFESIARLVAVEQSLLRAAQQDVLTHRDRDELCVWAPNTDADIAAWMSDAVSRMTTDRPDIALELRGAYGNGAR